MSHNLTTRLQLSPEQEAIRAKCFHPTGTFVEFTKEEVEHSIPERFEKIVANFPNHLAVKTRHRSLTYEALNQTANRIARAILERRGKGSEPVALLFEHGIDIITGIFGIIKSGKYYVALDPSSPQERLNYILKDSDAQLLITNSHNLDFSRALSNDVRATLNVDESIDSFSSNNLGLSISPDDLAAIVYTSGSTGEPKGVIHTHRSSLHKLVDYVNDTGISADDGLTLIHSVSFGAAQTDIILSLLNGASLFPFDIKTEGIHSLAEWLKDEKITICHLPPTVFRQLAGLLSDQEKPAKLRLIFLSGAPITQQDFDLYKKNFSSQTLLQIGMGSTETGGICCAFVDQTFCFPEEGAPVGYPCPDKKVLLFDENGQEVGLGKRGMIAVKSRYLTMGYWNRPELTKITFLPDPNGANERIYLTADLGRILPDGFLIHLGRKDDQVKIRGYRVELAEIERALLSHPHIKDAGVVAWEREPGEKYLVAYIVPRQHPAPTISDFREFLRGKLPDYMMPSAFMFLDSLPVTNGKLDRTALPKPEGKRPELSQPYILHRSEIEQKLVQIWEEVLDIRPIGIHDNFFDLGGHSLAATRVVSQVIKKFQLEIPPQSLFQSPTVAEMAAVITEHQGKRLGEEELTSILTELESLTDEEAQKLLSDQTGTGQRRD